MQEAISLYLDLKKGERADFEVVGLAGAAWAESVKEIAYFLEPGIEVRVEFESGVEGSLNLKAILRIVGTGRDRRRALLGIVATVAVVLGSDIRTYGVSKFLDWLLVPEQRQELSDEDIERVVRVVKEVEAGKVAKEPIRQMFKQLERDDRITSVGAVVKPAAKPLLPIPRSEFPARAGMVPLASEIARRKRKVKSIDRLLLISPVLVAADRVWRFRSFFGEFSYHVDDEKFRDSLLSGRRRLPMKAGIQLTANVETSEVFEGGVWVPIERHIVKVQRVHRVPEERDLFSEAVKPKTRKRK